jgi:hypothetical protein
VWPEWALSALQGIEPHEVMQALYAADRWPRPMVGLGGLELVAIWARTNASPSLVVALRPVGRLGLGGTDPSGQEVHAFLDSLTIGGTLPDVALPDQASTAMAVRSLRLVVDLDQRIKTVARARGAPAGALVREWIVLGLTATEDDAPISRADALRALAGLRPVPGRGSAAQTAAEVRRWHLGRSPPVASGRAAGRVELDPPGIPLPGVRG